MAREQPVEQRRADVPDVQEPGRRRRHADANAHARKLKLSGMERLAAARATRAGEARALLGDWRLLTSVRPGDASRRRAASVRLPLSRLRLAQRPALAPASAERLYIGSPDVVRGSLFGRDQEGARQ